MDGKLVSILALMLCLSQALAQGRLSSTDTSETSSYDMVEDLKQRLEVTDAQVQHLISQNEALEKQLESITLRLNTTVAFFVTPQAKKPHNMIGLFREDTVLKYDNIITNVGNAYNPSTGMFRAPVRGVYFFTFVVFNKLRFATEVKLMRNGEMVVSATDNQPRADPEDTTTNSATLLLETSDLVYIELLATKGIYADENGRSTFSGYLLYPV